MTTTYRSTRRDQAVADDYLANHLPCSFCGAPTEREILVEYGARCGPCFNAYVTGGRPNPPMPTLAQKVDLLKRLNAAVQGMRPSKVWAERLREREHAGDALSMAQRQAWRAALGHVDAAEVCA